MSEHEFQAFNSQVRDIWDKNADFWNEKMGEGNDFHKLLIEPNQLRLLDLRQDELVLDVACGNGQFARKMATLGARVVAFDISNGMIENARARTTENVDRIEYSVIDATDSTALLALGERRFDAAVCTMAIMDMASIEPLLSSLNRLLKVDGRFVFSVLHPCFNSASIKMVAEQQEDRDGDLVTEYSVRVSEYIKPSTKKGIAMLGQPVAQYYFDRPISVLFNACFAAGFALDGIAEPVFEQPRVGSTPISWGNFTDVPPMLVARMRLIGNQ